MQDCETFSTVVKMLVDKAPNLDQLLQAPLKENLTAIKERCLEDLKQFISELDQATQRPEVSLSLWSSNRRMGCSTVQEFPWEGLWETPKAPKMNVLRFIDLVPLPLLVLPPLLVPLPLLLLPFLLLPPLVPLPPLLTVQSLLLISNHYIVLKHWESRYLGLLRFSISLLSQVCFLDGHFESSLGNAP